MEELPFFNPYDDLWQTENRLPHWQQEGAVYFVTFHLADSVPKSVLLEWATEEAAWLEQNPRPWEDSIEREYSRRFLHRRERWLDAGHGACVLRRPPMAKLVADALAHFEGDRLHLLSSVVMPNHVHALFTPKPPWTVKQILHSWKSFTGHTVSRLLNLSGPFWMKDYYDRLIRNARHFENCVRYIRNNPARAKLREGEYLLWESERTRQVE